MISRKSREVSIAIASEDNVIINVADNEITYIFMFFGFLLTFIDMAHAFEPVNFSDLVANYSWQLPLNWGVGDKAEYRVSADILDKGTMLKTVVEDTGTALWVLEDMNIPSHKEVIKKLYNKEDGKVLSIIRAGNEQRRKILK